MAKSTRSKVKRAFRAKKRTEGVYAATEAARLRRLNTKLLALTTAVVNDDNDDDGNPKEEGEEERENQDQDARMTATAGDGDDAEMKSSTAVIEGIEGRAAPQKFKGKVSTHGPRGSRREQWRVSKGMAPRAKSRGVNRQGLVAARYKSGRPHRRR